jgi:type IV secretion system protein VirB9
MIFVAMTGAAVLAAAGSVSAPAALPRVAAHAAMLLAADEHLAGGGMRGRLKRASAVARRPVREPQRDFYVNAVQIYPWSEGALYRLYTAPERVSEIALQPGEALISVASGDTARWVIGDTASGTGASKQTHILVKPSAAGLRTNLLITTDRRLYRIELASTPATSMAGIAWTYPADELLALKGAEASAAAAQPVAALAVETLNFNYAISGDNVPWRPVRAFDDGRQVFIQFPANLGQGEAPPLFVVGEGGRAELVNYRVSGRYYVVDRLFGAAELRLGEKRQQVVRITRAGDGRRQRGARS